MASELTNSPSLKRQQTRMGAIGDLTFRGIGSLIKLLPTGTVFLFQFLSPVLSNNGHCAAANKVLTSVLLAFCGFSCGFNCFTDSYTGADGKVYYGIVTPKGMWPFWDPNPGKVDLSKYKLRLGDFVHAFYSVLVFAVIGLLDSNTVSCFYPSFEANQKILLMVLPPIVGGVASFIFALFPSTRHEIGYPADSGKNSGDTGSDAST